MTNKAILSAVVIAAVVVIGGGAYWVWQSGREGAANPSPSAPQGTQSPAASPGGAGSASQLIQTNLSYSDALRIYQDRRIQFTSGCVIIPNMVTYKTGTVIMLDNRTNEVDAVSLDAANYTLQPYGFTIVTLRTSYPLPHTINVESNSKSCGIGENNAKILLQG